MITKAEWELRRQQWRIFNEWEAVHPPPAPSAADALADVGAIWEWLPESVRYEDHDPERLGVQRMQRIFRILSERS